MRAQPRGDLWPAALGFVVAAAWLSLAAWQHSPYARYLDHGGWLETSFVGSLCRALPGGPVALPALIYLSGWLLMTIAMMLPTALPLIALFARMNKGRPNAGALIALLVAGYLSVWTVFGLVAHALDEVLRAAINESFLAFNGWIVGAAVVGTAGVFQFSRLKYHCLDQCRAPFSFINTYWRGAALRRQSFILGARHGLFCLGCCWAIMLLMFVVGMGSLGWMLAIGAVMALEKNARWGRRLGAPLGAALLLTSAAIVASHL